MNNQFIPSVNFHVWEPCNMHCKFCFATFQDIKQTILPKGHLPREQALEVVKMLAQYGFEKISFAGGEPTLCPWLPELIELAKDLGMTTMIITNGSNLTDRFLKINHEKLDWIGISIDSLSSESNLKIGRAISGSRALCLDDYKSIVNKVKTHGYGLKINTVVNRMNFEEDMTDFINYAQPKRWKILQALPINGQNDSNIDDMIVNELQFQSFVRNHESLNRFTNVVVETNSMIKGSYAMVDPAGRFFDNVEGVHNYSKPILSSGVEKAIREVNYDFEKYILRGGKYNWIK